MSESGTAEAALAQANALIDQRRFCEAVEPAGEACRLRPDLAAAWWSYGVALKHAQRWADCLEACDRAIALDPEDSAGPCWNAGIAATALGDWGRARAAWIAYGIPVPPGDGPPEMAIGNAGVRICVEAAPEVVICRRIDPCRARILSVPLPESGHRFGDVVLHDGEPRGKRSHGEASISVFDELRLLESAGYGTWRVAVTCRTPEERDALLALYDHVDGAIEDWTDSVVVLCAQCSLGERCEDHAREDTAWRPDRDLGLALRDERDLRRLRQLGLWWRRDVRDVTRML
jgi:tetratricopeptide (TPR) repeat protein